MKLLVSGASGVMGRAFVPLARAAGHELSAPSRTALDLFDATAVRAAARGVDGILHLATRIPSADRRRERDAWEENDRLRTLATAHLVDAALASEARVFVQPTVAFVYPPGGVATEDTPIGDVAPFLQSALSAEREVARLAAAGRRGVVLRLGLLDGPGTGLDAPNPVFGATLHVEDAARALLLALEAPSGIYNVCRDAERVANDKFSSATGWRPRLTAALRA